MRYVFGALILVWVIAAQATNVTGRMTYQGRALKTDNTPLEAASVSFIVQVKSVTNDCVLYEETHTKNMVGSNGIFSLKLGTGIRTGVDPGIIFKNVFSNAINFTGLNCGMGTTYNPASADIRRIKLSFNDGSGLVTLSPDMDVQSVPYAMYSESVQGKGASDLIQVNTTAPQELSQANIENIFSTTNHTELLALLAGTSTLYHKSSSSFNMSSQQTIGFGQFDNTQQAALIATPLNNTTDVGKTWVNSTTGKVMYWDGTSAVDLSAGGGGAVTSVFGRTGVVVATAGDYTAAEVTNVAAGGIASTDVQAAINELDTEKLSLSGGTMSGVIAMGSQKITGMADATNAQDAATLANVNAAIATNNGSYVAKAGDSMTGALAMGTNKITGLGTPTAGTDAVNKTYADGRLLGNTLAAPGGGQVGQSIRWNAGGTAWEYYTPSSGGISDVVSDTTPQLGGTLDINGQNMSTATGFNIDITGSSAGNDFTVDTDKLVVEGDTGNIGIGTASPTQKLHVVGNQYVSGLFEWNANKGRLTSGAAGIPTVTTTGAHDLSLGTGTSGEIIRLDEATGNVGVGTASPNAKVHITGTTTQDGIFVDLAASTSNNVLMGKAGANITHNLYTSNDSAMYAMHHGGVEMNRFDSNGDSFITGGNVGIGTATPDASALLDVSSTTKGFLPPRMTTAQRDAIGTPGMGLQVYNITTNKLNLYDGSSWGEVGGSGSSADSLAIIVDQKADGTDGGDNDPAAGFETRDLNTELFDPSGIVSISSNQFTLGAGTYEINAQVPAFQVDDHQARLRNITDGTTALVGTSEFSQDSSTYTTSKSLISGVITLSASKTFEIQHETDADTGGTLNFGRATDFTGEPEVYTVVRIKKIGGATLGNVTQVLDADSDTKIQVEESSDEDIIRFDTAGTERMTIAADGSVNVVGSLTAGTLVGDASGVTNIGASAIADGSITLADVDFGSATTGINIPQLASDPGSPTAGQQYFNTTSNKLMVYNGSSWVEVGAGGGGGSSETYLASQATTSGTQVDFTGIPSTATEIKILLDQVSLSAAGELLIQIGDSGGIETTGYTGASSAITTVVGTSSSTAHFPVRVLSAARQESGVLTLKRFSASSSKWVLSGVVGDQASTQSAVAGGSKTLSGTLDRIRISSSSGNFDNGEISVVHSSGLSSGSSVNLADVDNDTLIHTEESSDEDIIRFDTAGTERMVIDASGNVGIGTGSPNASAKLDVDGTMVSRAHDAVAATTFDWANGNVQYTSASCGAMTLSNMLDGGSYTLIVKGTTSGTCAFTHVGMTVKMPLGHGATDNGTHTIYSFLRAGTDIYVTWIKGY